MDSSDHRPNRDDDDLEIQSNNPSVLSYSITGVGAGTGNAFHQPVSPGTLSGYTLMVAGQRTGKTSFLRLLLDTSDISQMATKDQLASIAKFVQGSSGHTSHIRTASFDIELDAQFNSAPQHLTLSLVDTPSLDFSDETSAERLVSELLRHVDSRFAEGLEDDRKAQDGGHHVHLCIYFLDPDAIIPPAAPGPPAPLVPRARTNSFNQPEPEPVILEPPVTTNPLLCRATLPPAEISTIRRLSARVNVLPVVARADTLTNDRLTAIKMAVRRDLAEAGIGFGIFDMDGQYHLKDEHPGHSLNGDPSNGYSGIPNGSSSGVNSPPSSPITPSLLRLPYALISPDIYSHSDGVTRIPLSRHELVLQYAPTSHPSSSSILPGKFIRSFRWGSLDVLDPNHCDFLPLRAAIFHHMETLQKYTREYLFEKFKADYQLQQQSQPHHRMTHHVPQGLPSRSHLPSLSHSRPILAIDTAPSHPVTNRHPSLSLSRNMGISNEIRPNNMVRAAPDAASNMSSKTSSSGPRSSKQRTKKITVACNFCRSRKLKCDGGRPACSQCVKRSNPCDYMPQNKRRGIVRQRKGDESESDSGEDRSMDAEEPSVSPEIPSQPLSRRSSNVERSNRDAFMPLLDVPPERREVPPLASTSRLKHTVSISHVPEPRTLFKDNELPHIATLSLPDPSPTTISTPSLPPIRPASEQQAAQRKRATTLPGKSSRQPSSSGPKVVACNFCRARKTKCDGVHPTCSSCTRRSLPCNYVHDAASNGTGQKKAARRASTSKVPPAGSSHSHSHSPPSVSHTPHLAPTSSNTSEGYRHRENMQDNEFDLKRNSMEDLTANRPTKKMRMESPPVQATEVL